MLLALQSMRKVNTGMHVSCICFSLIIVKIITPPPHWGLIGLGRWSLEMGSTLLKEEDPTPHVICELPLLTLLRISMDFLHERHPQTFGQHP